MSIISEATWKKAMYYMHTYKMQQIDQPNLTFFNYLQLNMYCPNPKYLFRDQKFLTCFYEKLKTDSYGFFDQSDSFITISFSNFPTLLLHIRNCCELFWQQWFHEKKSHFLFTTCSNLRPWEQTAWELKPHYLLSKKDQVPIRTSQSEMR